MRFLAFLLLLAACKEQKLDIDARWFSDASFDHGAAVVCTYEGRFKRYGVWRPAVVTDYVIREYLDPEELTKRDVVRDGLIPVIKVNRHVTFRTGTYPYRLMHSLFFDRRDGSLVKAVGTSQEGCGIAFQRWDRRSRALAYDTYWEGEGAGSRKFQKSGAALFDDEVPFVAARVPDGTSIRVWPSLMRSKVAGFTSKDARVTRKGGAVHVGGESVFQYDEAGFLTAWKTPGAEFRRVGKKRLYYWQHTDNGDEKLLR